MSNNQYITCKPRALSIANVKVYSHLMSGDEVWTFKIFIETYFPQIPRGCGQW